VLARHIHQSVSHSQLNTATLSDAETQNLIFIMSTGSPPTSDQKRPLSPPPQTQKSDLSFPALCVGAPRHYYHPRRAHPRSAAIPGSLSSATLSTCRTLQQGPHRFHLSVTKALTRLHPIKPRPPFSLQSRVSRHLLATPWPLDIGATHEASKNKWSHTPETRSLWR